MKSIRVVILTVGLTIILSACNLPGGENQTVEPRDILLTAAFETLVVESGGNPNLLFPTATTFIFDPVETTPAPTFTQIIIPSATQTSPPICDLAGFEADITVPDGTEFTPGDTFTKTWRLTNIGTCTWNSDYDLIFNSGDKMAGPTSQQLTTSSVSPGQTIDVSVDLTAPTEPDTYRGNWKLRSGDNIIFGLPNGSPFWVEIIVLDLTSTSSPTSTITLTETLTPTATTVSLDFSISYDSQWLCDTTDMVSFNVVNNSSFDFEYLQIDVEGPIGTQLNSDSQNTPFRPQPPQASPQCAQAGADSLAAAGGTMWVGTSIPAAVTGGESGRVIITFCTQDDNNGICTQKSLDFTW